MKTLFEKLLIPFEFITHPAASWFGRSTPAVNPAAKARTTGRKLAPVLSPDGYNLRGGSKKGGNRYNPAP